MSDLVEWLRGVLDEDERIARKAAGTAWEKRAFHWHADGREVRCEYGNTLIVKFSWPQEIEHIVLHDPAAVLADIEAKRKIIDLHFEINADCTICVVPRWGYPVHGGCDPQRWPCPTLLLLASAYAHRPGYRPEWSPEA